MPRAEGLKLPPVVSRVRQMHPKLMGGPSNLIEGPEGPRGLQACELPVPHDLATCTAGVPTS